MSDSAFEGYHQFPHGGSFEVFYHDKDDNDLAMNDHGWYWWACQPGWRRDRALKTRTTSNPRIVGTRS